MNDHAPTCDEAVDSTHCKLIAWLSVCVLAAAWGSNLDPHWRPLWQQAGAFGLVSAVGLSAARRVRATYRNRVEQRSVEAQLTRRLASELFTQDASERLRTVIDRFLADFDGWASTPTDRLVGTDDHGPVEIYYLDCARPGATQLENPSAVARVRNISQVGIGLVHPGPLRTGPALLAYETRDGARLVIGTEISWCRPTGDGESISGGRFVEFSQFQAALDEQPVVAGQA
ncbi:MAG: hypothetical protein JNG90_18650 [Planctomycetaceae bacterium]|nr:hypothetical protein [Planctomycetaceae bacterium]